MPEITIIDIAKECGVGVSTVSRAINNHSDINPQTKKRILSVIAHNGYVPNNSARNLKRLQAESIAVLMKGITNPLFSPMIQIIEQETKKKKYVLEIKQVEFYEDEMDVAAELIKEKRLRGIIFLGGYFHHAKDKMKKLTVPYVFGTVGMAVPEGMDPCNYSSVAVDDRKESEKIVSFLIELGHQQIAYISAESEVNSIGQLRLKGYVDALQKYGITYDEQLVLKVKHHIPHFSMENGYETMKQFLKTKKPFTAVYTTADMLAVGACRALLEEGKRIPKDVSVAGFDGIEVSKYYNPSITTIRQPIEEMASCAVDLLFDRIEGGKSHKHIVFPAELIKRESTGVRKMTGD